MKLIYIRIHYLLFTLVLFTFSSEASTQRFSTEVYENFHAGRIAPKNLRDYIEAQDYRSALMFAEQNILTLDLVNADPKQVADLIEKTAEILAKHADVAAVENDSSWITWTEAAFAAHKRLAEFEVANPSNCALQGDYFKRFIVDATGQAIKPMAQIWDDVKKSMRSGETLSDMTQRDIGAVIVLNAIFCVKTSNESERNDGVLRENGGVWVWSLAYSGVGMQNNRVKKLRQDLGAKFDEFLRQYEEASENNRAWNYPGIVSYIPALKNPRKALQNFVGDLQRQLKMSPRREVAAFAHQRFVKLHLFKDGNGRLGRILANVILEQVNQKPLIVTDDPCYMKATEQGFNDLQRFVDFMDDPTCSLRTEL
jgi:hypothetical protein